MDIAILALDGVFDTGLATVLDTLTIANELAVMQACPSVQFNIFIVGVRPHIRSSQQLSLSVMPVTACPKPDWVIMPALGDKMPEPLQQALIREDVIDALTVLRNWGEAGIRIATACTGSFILAESGLLDDHQATTSWWLTPLFRQRYPSVRLDAHRMVVNSGPFVTAGAALGHIDMMLWLIRQASPELAAMVASYLIVDSRPTQSAYVISDHLAHSDPLIERFDLRVRKHLHQGFNLEQIARELATSKRTLARRIRNVLGKTPVSYVQDLRIEHAVHLLKTSNNSVDKIANLVGYADGATLRILLRRRLGKGIREIKGSDHQHRV